MDVNYAHILLLDCRPFRDGSLFEKGLLLVNEERREKVLKYRFEKDRQLSLGAGLAGLFLLKEQGLSPEDLIYDQNKKPVIQRPDVYISLSHSGHFVCAGLSDSPIGVDVEKKDGANTDLAKRFFSPEEYEKIQNSEDPVGEFYRFWSRKECMLKRDGIKDLRELLPDRINTGGKFVSYPLKGYSCEVYVSEALVPDMRILNINDIITLKSYV